MYAGSRRFGTRRPDRTTRHSFSFGEHYDPANLGFGPLVCHNDDLLLPGGGYPDHPHADLEIVTWVLDGVLLHTDPAGRTTPLTPGTVAVTSAGSGIRHAEVGDPAAGPTRFLQCWVRPDEPGTPPRHTLADPALGTGALVPVVGAGALPLGTAGARLDVARLRSGDTVRLPAGPRQHLFAATGAVEVGEQQLAAGDALRILDEPGLPVTAREDAELLVWTFATPSGG